MKKKVKRRGSKPKSVLVIDDEQSICGFFTDLFDEYDINIDTELTGASGLKRVLGDSYSLIFLDVKLGDTDGISVLRKIKKHDPDTKVVMISGYLTEDIIEQALKFGADGYLYKPISIRDIMSMTLRFLDAEELNHGDIVTAL